MNLMQKARTKLLIKHAFFGSLVMSTPMIEDRSIPTAYVDGLTMHYNPDFIESLGSLDLVQFVLIHETMHNALEHGLRLLSRDPELWNQACDYVINWMVKEAGFTVWDQCLIDPQYDGMSAEQIYERLRQQGGGRSDGLGRDVKAPSGAGDPSVAEAIRQEARARISRAATMGRMAGHMSAGLERLVGDILAPKAPWYELLRDYMSRLAKDDESWSKRNRRYETYLPSRHSVRLGDVVVIGDTSGSMTDDDAAKLAAEVRSFAELCHPESIRLLWVDAAVCAEHVFGEDEELDFRPKGGGGTDMTVGLRHAEQYDPAVVVLVSDGYSPWPESEPPYPLIICCTSDVDVPVGQVVRL